MLFRTLALCLLFVASASFAQGRKPAVEDFVGIEIEHPETTPQGTEPLFNLEQDLSKHVETKAKNAPTSKVVKSEVPTWNLFSLIALSLTMGLPLIMWLMIMSHMRKKASVENATNIEILEKYRKDRERTKTNEEITKKAS